uniref:Uncharacterized protein n=1 Tax=Eutreptiella gymnastica TaxID=73025 RepID=A0A7S4FK02_9EUGL|mmetsp:Transcript_83208/g.139059  ORF Transcript_83208/g.139059 Transcript_83208/m.139059 type:complete len:166 (-) Transcript_83208:1416-1913(-)
MDSPECKIEEFFWSVEVQRHPQFSACNTAHGKEFNGGSHVLHPPYKPPECYSFWVSHASAAPMSAQLHTPARSAPLGKYKCTKTCYTQDMGKAGVSGSLSMREPPCQCARLYCFVHMHTSICAHGAGPEGESGEGWSQPPPAEPGSQKTHKVQQEKQGKGTGKRT